MVRYTKEYFIADLLGLVMALLMVYLVWRL